jgi:thioesterase domain-containing protein
MIPAFFVFLDKIPLTSNGKIDRKSLIGVNLFSPKNFENSSYHSISKTTELTLIRIWEKILNTSNIPTDQSFFTLGGNSILSIRMLFYIQNIFYSNLSIADIFKNQTIESLAILINRKKGKTVNPYIFCISDSKKKNPLFMIHPVGGLSYCYLGLNQYMDRPIYGINSPEVFDPPKHFSSIEEISCFYISMIKKLYPTGPYYIGGWSTGGLIAYEIAQQLFSKKEKVELLLLIDTECPENLQINSLKQDTNKFLQEIIEPPDSPRVSPMMARQVLEWEKKLKKYALKKYNGKAIFLVAKKNVFCQKENLYGWDKFIKELCITQVPGTHMELFDNSYIQSTCDTIEKYLIEAEVSAKSRTGGAIPKRTGRVNS